MVPITLVTGFLGAGKTTLLNRLLADPATPPTAVIVNEFGALGIDGRLVVGASDEVIELRNGCICCEVREDLRRTVLDLLKKRARWLRPLRFDRIVVETSGVAAPGPLVQTCLLDSELAVATRVDGVVALAHAGLVVAQLATHPEVPAQLACADRIVLNHLDQAADIDAAEAAVRAVAPLAELLRGVRADVPVAPLLNIGGADPTRWILPPLVTHSAGIVTASLRGGAIDLARLKMYLQFVASRRGWEVLRLKGIFRCPGVATAVVAQGVHQWLELGPGAMPPPEESALVVIGRGIDVEELRRGWDVIR
ncbi:MAG: GTP-binding protein [Pseudomonadota bacterium]|nr:GTP-binding protein [Pseudomonadota bacterium]